MKFVRKEKSISGRTKDVRFECACNDDDGKTENPCLKKRRIEQVNHHNEKNVSVIRYCDDETNASIESVSKSWTRNRRRRKWSSRHMIDNDTRRESLLLPLSRLESSTIEGYAWTSNTKRENGKTHYLAAQFHDDFCSWDTDATENTPRMMPGSSNYFNSKFTSVSKLLYSREVGQYKSYFRGGDNWNTNWTTSMLKRRVPKEGTMSRKMEWKPFLARSIPFSKLETPTTDAVLALDRFGSYMISISDNKYFNGTVVMGEGGLAILALRFYGESFYFICIR